MMSFAERYGPWAVISGASEGTGRAFAQQVAANGVNCILIARREAPLAELAQQIRRESGVECLYASVDLSSPDAFDKIIAVVAGREVGLFINNAGADSNGSHFLNKDIDTWIGMLNRNLITSLRCTHHFAGLMRQRKKGGLLFVGSGAGWGGGPFMAAYSGAKAFDLCFTESLWAELKPHGVDVLHLVLTVTDTPALRQLLKDKGQPLPSKMAPPEKVAAAGLAHLSRGPHYNWGQLFGLRAGWRRLRVRLVAAYSQKIFGAG